MNKEINPSRSLSVVREWVKAVFQNAGFNVEAVSSDHLDFVTYPVTEPSRRHAVSCVFDAETFGRRELSDIRDEAERMGYQSVEAISDGEFTIEAKQAADEWGIRLTDGDKLKEVLGDLPKSVRENLMDRRSQASELPAVGVISRSVCEFVIPVKGVAKETSALTTEDESIVEEYSFANSEIPAMREDAPPLVESPHFIGPRNREDHSVCRDSDEKVGQDSKRDLENGTTQEPLVSDDPKGDEQFAPFVFQEESNWEWMAKEDNPFDFEQSAPEDSVPPLENHNSIVETNLGNESSGEEEISAFAPLVKAEEEDFGSVGSFTSESSSEIALEPFSNELTKEELPEPLESETPPPLSEALFSQDEDSFSGIAVESETDENSSLSEGLTTDQSAPAEFFDDSLIVVEEGKQVVENATDASYSNPFRKPEVKPDFPSASSIEAGDPLEDSSNFDDSISDSVTLHHIAPKFSEEESSDSESMVDSELTPPVLVGLPTETTSDIDLDGSMESGTSSVTTIAEPGTYGEDLEENTQGNFEGIGDVESVEQSKKIDKFPANKKVAGMILGGLAGLGVLTFLITLGGKSLTGNGTGELAGWFKRDTGSQGRATEVHPNSEVGTSKGPGNSGSFEHLGEIVQLEISPNATLKAGKDSKMLSFTQDLLGLDEVDRPGFREFGDQLAKRIVEGDDPFLKIPQNEKVTSDLRALPRLYPRLTAGLVIHVLEGEEINETYSSVLPFVDDSVLRFQLHCKMAGYTYSQEDFQLALSGLQTMLDETEGLSDLDDAIAVEILLHGPASSVMGEDHEHWATVVGEHEKTPEWLRDLVRGRHFHLAAQKGGDEVENFKLAAEAYTRSWESNPDHPEAAGLMIEVSRDNGGSLEEARTWFDRSIASRADLIEAYQNYIDCLSPENLGSDDHLAAFGKACLATGMYESGIPEMLLLTHRTRARASGSERAYWSNLNVTEKSDLVRYFRGEQDTLAPGERTAAFRTREAAVWYLCKELERMTLALEGNGMRVDKKRLRLYPVSMGEMLAAAERHREQNPSGSLVLDNHLEVLAENLKPEGSVSNSREPVSTTISQE